MGMAGFVEQLKDMLFVLVQRVTGNGREEEDPELRTVQRVQVVTSQNLKAKAGDLNRGLDENGGSLDGVNNHTR
ncbi:hypothetical protein ACP4OV_025705 [Aristida adscensionis]